MADSDCRKVENCVVAQSCVANTNTILEEDTFPTFHTTFDNYRANLDFKIVYLILTLILVHFLHVSDVRVLGQ